MEMLNTPGPWEVDGARIYSTTKSLIATVGHFRSHETESANARLISVSPELLDAAIAYIEEREREERDGVWGAQARGLRQKLKAAVIKATTA